MGNEASYHKEQAKLYSKSRYDKYNLTYDEQKQRDYHLRKLKNIQEKEDRRRDKIQAQQEAQRRAERNRIIATPLFPQQEPLTPSSSRYRYPQQRQSQGLNHCDDERSAKFNAGYDRNGNAIMSNRRYRSQQQETTTDDYSSDKQRCMLAIYKIFNACENECEQWDDDTFAHLSPSSEEIHRRIAQVDANLDSCNLRELYELQKQVDEWNFAHRTELAKMEAVNNCVKDWNQLLSRVKEAGGSVNLPRYERQQFAEIEAIVDYLLEHRPQLSLDFIRNKKVPRFQELKDGLNKHLNGTEQDADRSNKASHKSTSATHSNVECDQCKAWPVIGPRYTCADCNDSFDLCQSCYAHCDENVLNKIHQCHFFLKTDHPGARPVPLRPRKGAYWTNPKSPHAIKQLDELYRKHKIDFRILYSMDLY